MVAVLMMPAKMATLDLFKIKVFWNKGYEVRTSIYDVINRNLSRNSNYIIDVAMWPKFGNFRLLWGKLSNLTLIQIFWNTKTFFKKLKYRFLVETTKIEKTSFPFKTALLEANVKTNRVATTKWTYYKEWTFASNYFIFLESLFQF